MKCRDCENLDWYHDEGEQIWRCERCYCPDLDIDRDCPDFAIKEPDIFTALSTLRAENEQLRAELEQVKRERDKYSTSEPGNSFTLAQSYGACRNYIPGEDSDNG